MTRCLLLTFVLSAPLHAESPPRDHEFDGTASRVVLGNQLARPMTMMAFSAGVGEAEGKTHRVYSHLLKPAEHPDYDRRHVQPPSWETFGGRTRFAALRGFQIRDGRIVNYAEELEKYTRTYALGDVIWPSYPILFAENLDELASEIRKRDLFLFDIWGFVPGSGPGGYWQQFVPPEGVFPMLESKLGKRWLGMDVGEQDGRYVGGYAAQMYPTSLGRLDQYLNFQRHFQRICDSLGNRMATLVSLNFGHYLLKEGVYTLIGAETAQALPNGQVYYAFIRGAGKQYGVPWFGNASVWNRWGWKTYGAVGQRNGPTKGTSLSLLKRLLYSQILYNSVFVGFESSWLDGETLSPIGRIQQAARKWIQHHGQPGVMVTPIAVMVDFFSGWSFPRHLYTPEVYRVWGNLPYEAGDYLTDGVLDMLYPGYQDSSYFHDESGFLCPTPYADAADCLLSDAPGWLLARYPVLVVAGALSGGAEIRDKLQAYLEGGGQLVITAGSLAKLPGGIAGIRVIGSPARFPEGQEVRFESNLVKEETAFELCRLSLPQDAKVLARCGTSPAVVTAICGRGRVVVLASPFGIAADPAVPGQISNGVDKSLAKPFPLLKHVRHVLAQVLAGQVLFEAGQGLSLITCRKGPGQYTLGISNNGLRPLPLKIVSHCGRIESVRECMLDQSEKGAVGYLPQGSEQATIGTSGKGIIAGGDIRIFAVRVAEGNIAEIPHKIPPPRPRGRVLPLRDVGSIKEAVLARPTFFEHFDGVMVDWKYLHRREIDAIEKQAGWIRRQSLRVIVDLTSGINLYPDLRLIDNIQADHAASMAAIEDVLAKMATLGAKDLILALHRSPENNFTRDQTWASFDATLRRVCQAAAAKQITVHLRVCRNRPPSSIPEALALLDRVDQENLRLAPSTNRLLSGGKPPKVIAEQLRGKLGLWMVSGTALDALGRTWNENAPIAGGRNLDRLARLLAAAPNVTRVLDVVYANQDAEYHDARTVDRLAPRVRGR